jgi:hypothetical protein
MKITDTTIEFPNYTISNHPEGIEINGVFKAASFGVFPPPMKGTVSGYSSGGLNPTFGGRLNTIDKFPFAADANATDVGDLTQARDRVAGQSSQVSGYTTGGIISSPPVVNTNRIDKFPFASNANATTVGNLTQGRYGVTGQSSYDFGYTSGGYAPPNVTRIDKVPFVSNANATTVGNLTQARQTAAGQSSTESGYTSGGQQGVDRRNTIDKFPFAADANATDVGDLTQVRSTVAGQSSTASGYSSGGYAPPVVNTIDKFPFASNANATDVGDLTQARSGPAGQSSIASGYTSGGAAFSNVIDKFSFAADANATDVGDLTQPRTNLTGQQD